MIFVRHLVSSVILPQAKMDINDRCYRMEKKKGEETMWGLDIELSCI